MIDPEMEPFRKTKPMIIAPQKDGRLKKRLDLDFQDCLDKKMEEFEEDNTSPEDKQKQKNAEIKATRQMSKFLQGVSSFIPRETIARFEQPTSKKGRKFNYEEEDGPYYPEKLATPFYNAEDDDALLQNIFEDDGFINQASELPGEGSTIPHNINLLKGVNTNIFKKGDKENYEIFEEDEHFSLLHKQFMSPRGILEKIDKNYYSYIKSGMDRILEKKIPRGLDDLEPFKNPYVSKDDQDLNWEDAPDPYIDNDIETFDIYANFHTILMSQQWLHWTDEEVFSFINFAYESRTRVEDSLRDIIGRSVETRVIQDECIKQFKTDSELNTSTSTEVTEEDITDEAIIKPALEDSEAATLLEEEETVPEISEKERTNMLLDRVKEWDQNIAVGNDVSMSFLFGLFSNVIPMVISMSEWSNWAENAAEDARNKMMADDFGFKDKMIGGYLRHSFKKYVDSTDSFLNREKLDNNSTSFNLFPNAKSDGTNLFSIRLKCKDESYRDFNELIGLLDSGDNAIERIENASIVYNTLFRMYSTITSLNTDSNNIQNPVYNKLDNGLLELTIFPEAEWEQSTPAIENEDTDETAISSTLRKLQGTLKLQFESPEQIEALQEDIRALLSLLEPVVGTFGIREEGEEFFILIDNTGSTESVEMITSESKNYRIQIDTLFNPEFFKTNSWQTVSEYMKERSIGTITKELNTTAAINQILRFENTREKEDYNKEEEEHYEEQIEIKRNEITQKNRRRKEEQKNNLKIKKARKKQIQENKKREILKQQRKMKEFIKAQKKKQKKQKEENEKKGG